MCPLSGKKFKAPDFIRKHIFNKLPEELEKVKRETEFYNNYIRDPSRPELPEHLNQFINPAGVTKVKYIHDQFRVSF